jgi:hypothetical protein
MPPSLTERTAFPCLELLGCELLANPAAVADVLVLKLYHARKAWVNTEDPYRLSGVDSVKWGVHATPPSTSWAENTFTECTAMSILLYSLVCGCIIYAAVIQTTEMRGKTVE